MKCSLAAWFTIWSIATVVKFISKISATGRIPAMAAPIAAPMMACFRRCGGYPRLVGRRPVDRPLVTLNVPPVSASPMSSPRTNTLGSASMASSRASVKHASPNVTFPDARHRLGHHGHTATSSL